MDRRKYLTLAEVRRLRLSCARWAETGGRRARLSRLVVELALFTGLRRCELARIRVRDVDLERATLWVRTAKRKGHRGDTLPLPPDLVNVIGQTLVTGGRAENQLLRGQRGPLTGSGIARIWKKACVRAGIGAWNIHAARHTCAMHLLDRTGNLRQVQQQLRHASPVTTAKMYASVSWERMLSGVSELYDERKTSCLND